MKKYDIDTIKFCTDVIVSLLERRAFEFSPDDAHAKWSDDMYISGYREGYEDGYFDLLNDLDNLIGGCRLLFEDAEDAEEKEKANELKNRKD